MSSPESEPLSLEEAMARFPPMWTIYDHPKDYPEGFIARLWYGETPTLETITGYTLNQVRGLLLAQGSSLAMVRSPEDDPCIVETWL